MGWIGRASEPFWQEIKGLGRNATQHTSGDKKRERWIKGKIHRMRKDAAKSKKMMMGCEICGGEETGM